MVRAKTLSCATRLALLVGSLAGCTSTRSAVVKSTAHHRLRVRAYVDGSDFLLLHGDRVGWSHRDWDRPGLPGEQNQPTMLDDIPWFPTWDDGGRSNEVAIDERVPSKGDAHFRVTPVRARGKVALIESPSEKNGGVARVLFDDDDVLGAAWYEIAIEWD